MTALSSRTLAIVLGMTLVWVFGGCGSSQPDPVAIPVAAPSRPKTPPAPPPPAVTPVSQLMADLGIDQRVSLPEELAPMTDVERKAVLEFFDSFARGDEKALGRMLTKVDRDELDDLVETGAWAEATGTISAIDVETGTSPHNGEPCVLAIFYTDSSFQPQMWYYTTDKGTPEFDAVASPPNMMDRLYGEDRIAQWFGVLDEEMALADKPDEEFVVPQREVGDDTPRPRSGGGGPAVNPSRPNTPSNPSKPSAPDSPGRRPKRGKRPAPGRG